MHDLKIKKSGSAIEIPEFKLPSLMGENIQEHFLNMGRMEAKPYLDYAYELYSCGVPEKPKKFAMRAGWTKYGDGGDEEVEFPDEKILVFDVEVLAENDNKYPTMAVAVSPTNWYSWVSPRFLDENDETSCRLIPLGKVGPRLIVGHNVSFDRKCILEEYNIGGTENRFMDTLSLHCAVSGLSSQQRLEFMKAKSSKNKEINDELEDMEQEILNANDVRFSWMDVVALNNLKSCAELHLGIEMNKEIRNDFFKKTRNEILENFGTYIDYCATDVSITQKLFKKLWPLFREKNPHPVTFVSSLEMGSCFLPTNSGWNEYIEKCERIYNEEEEKIHHKLRKLAYSTLETKNKEDDPWLRRLDWTPKPERYTKPLYKKDGTYRKNKEPRPIGNVKLFNKPEWFVKHWCNSIDDILLTIRTKEVPYLLKASWHGYPIHHLKEFGWTFVVPLNEKESVIEKTATNPIYQDEFNAYFKIKNLKREGENVGNILTKSYIPYFEKGILSFKEEIGKEIMELNSKFTFWVSYKSRLANQFLITENEPNVSLGFSSRDQNRKSGVILPGIIPFGTITRRAVEPTWMTASNAKKHLVGSEMKSKIVAPLGYSFVGADVDSQELWISSIIGDSQFGEHGVTAFGWMTLQGSKNDGTDLHSRTASILNMSRNDAKVFNYSRIYGAGVSFATNLLLNFNPTLSKEEAQSKAKELYNRTKGRRVKNCYSGGSESFVFTALERIANSDVPNTPALGCVISDGLLSRYVGKQYMTSRVNWTVQSSGVDYLHLLIISMKYLCKKYKIHARLSITIHDEVRFLVSDTDKYRCALALQIANLWTRCLFSYMLGMQDLPASVAFFSCVDIDFVLRKEVDYPCITPSSTDPIPSGESLTIQQVLEKTDGLLSNGIEELPDNSSDIVPAGFAHETRHLEPLRIDFLSESHIQNLLTQIGDKELWKQYKKARRMASL
ncbi:hypothetical protein ROZALSC1DRAFT_28342 [Rozella allomycis CSF55]|uniref:Mitochondrial DNA polymerase catalytic subunit n=1 Tax=Rozella allomycis (strain CSF55) TaxID=988480 RepID=A0A075B014_ROZAC|nr:DNA-directed DNA polymerase, family A, palm domain-containing protein [Rozella allomycis CSF55]RKP20143.1 hypothetical protein ROZALSC1DRAFT_28342 [Rozella allomycis CSF55]|eukprot:EPZ34297.1 DNA-directed DNA polymerase, family A, palm domain-containing protein [Rozella allomycis CSF55]